MNIHIMNIETTVGQCLLNPGVSGSYHFWTSKPNQWQHPEVWGSHLGYRRDLIPWPLCMTGRKAKEKANSKTQRDRFGEDTAALAFGVTLEKQADLGSICSSAVCP